MYKGKYKKRADYYDRLGCDDNKNVHLDIYHSVVALYNAYHIFGVQHFNLPSSNEIPISTIRDTAGLARCWGDASEVLNLISRWRKSIAIIHPISAEVHEESDGGSIGLELVKALESLMEMILEILPAYVKWIPVANNEKNQEMVKFLQERSNSYCGIGNPKFYAYDRVITNICEASFPVNSANCVFIEGVGPRITQHIRDFLAGENDDDLSAEEQEKLSDKQVDTLYKSKNVLESESESGSDKEKNDNDKDDKEKDDNNNNEIPVKKRQKCKD